MQRQRHVDLSGVGMTLSGWEFAEERARVHAGTLTELGRLILWSPKKGKLEPSHFSVVPFKNLKHPPPDIEARTKLSLKARMAVRTLYYKPPAVREWKSSVFIRCEKGTWSTTDLIPTTFNTQPLLFRVYKQWAFVYRCHPEGGGGSTRPRGVLVRLLPKVRLHPGRGVLQGRAEVPGRLL